MHNSKCKMQNGGVCFAHILKSFPKEIPQFCILHSAFCISGAARQTIIYIDFRQYTMDVVLLQGYAGFRKRIKTFWIPYGIFPVFGVK